MVLHGHLFMAGGISSSSLHVLLSARPSITCLCTFQNSVHLCLLFICVLFIHLKLLFTKLKFLLNYIWIKLRRKGIEQKEKRAKRKKENGMISKASFVSLRGKRIVKPFKIFPFVERFCHQ